MDTITSAIMVEKVLGTEGMGKNPKLKALFEEVKLRKRMIAEIKEDFADYGLDEHDSYQIFFGQDEVVRQFDKELKKGNKPAIRQLEQYTYKRFYLPPEIVERLRSFYKSSGEGNLIAKRVFEETNEKGKLEEAEEFMEQGNYVMAYWRFKWANKLKGENLKRVMEGMEKDILEKEHLHQFYLDACIREGHKNSSILEKLALYFMNKNMFGSALKCYYIMENKEKISKLIEAIAEAAEK